MLRYAAIAIFIPLSLSIASAEVYKWVDEDGHMQYSDNPQAIKKAQAVPVQKSPPPDPETLKRNENQQRYLDARGKERQQELSDKEKSSQQQAEAKKYCDKVKERIAVLEGGGRIYSKSEGGEHNYLTEEDRQKELELSKGDIKKHCK